MGAGDGSGGARDPVLVVDDEPAIRALFVRTLQRAGYATREAGDGLEALAVIEREPVSLLLLDSTMPRVDGPAVIAALRARPGGHALPIILVTARAALADRVRGLEAGADDYLAKPVQLDELVARVRAQLRERAAWRHAIAQDADNRRALAAVLRDVDVDGSADELADSICARLSLALDGAATAILVLDARGSVRALAATGHLAQRYPAGLPVRRSEAALLRARATDGPWIDREARADRPDPALAASGWPEVAWLPLTDAEGPIGLLAIGGVGDSARAGEPALPRRLPALVDLAASVETLLGTNLRAGARRRQDRSALVTLIAKRRFVPHFQPIVELRTGTVLASEALTRFLDGTRPDVVFARAERLALGRALEHATLESAVMAAARLAPGTSLSLNVSPAHLLADQRLPELVARAGRPVVIEITEHAPIEDYAAIHDRIAALGPSTRLAVDDAGSGYASLRHIVALRPDFVKIDLDLVRGIDADRARQALIAGLAHFAAETGCELIGEGIETAAERAALLDLGVRYGQGYLLGRPATPTVH